MSSVDLQTPVGQLVAESPRRARVFERFGIDYCCGGKTPLDQACAAKGVDMQELIKDLTHCDSEDMVATETDWSKASVRELIQHIIKAYHEPLRVELPRLTRLVGKVAGVHGERHPELKELQDVFNAFRGDLEAHMQKEDVILFPLCVQLETASSLPITHCGSIKNPITVMRLEHDDAGAALAKMRTLTNNYNPPEDACGSYKALYDGLAELTFKMHEHVHKENNILFPRAKALEDRFTRASR